MSWLVLDWARLTGEDWGGLLVSLSPPSSRLTGLVWGGGMWPSSRGTGRLGRDPDRVDTGGRLTGTCNYTVRR